MEKLPLEVNFRSDMSKGRKNRIRRDGFVTGSIFGQEHEPVSVEVNINDLVKLVKSTDSGSKAIFDLKIKDAPESSSGIAIIKEIIKNPLTKKVVDIQFMRISMKEKVNVNIPVNFVGVPVGLNQGGILEEILNELHVRCLPGNIPGYIDVDVSKLGAREHITVADLVLAEGIEVQNEPDAYVCAIMMSQAAIAANRDGEEATEAAE